jgi:signal transduction histidine kinase
LGWFSGGVSLTLLVMPVLWLGARRWMKFRRALVPDGERPLASFRFTTTSVAAAGLMVAAFLAGSNYVAATRLSATLETGVLPKVQDRIWAAVAGWQIAAWSAIFLIALITVGTLILSRWWSQRWISQNAALRAAVEAANLASKVKGDFLATMSHELRTPMHGVLGLDEMLLATNLDDEQRDYAMLIDKSARWLISAAG